MFTWNIDPNFFHIPDLVPLLGGRGIRYYGVLFALGLMVGFSMWQWQMIRSGRTKEQAERLLTVGVIGVIAGARLGHCLFYEPGRYLKNPISVFYFWEGGLASHGATIGLILALLYFARAEKIPLAEVMDRFAMPTAWAAALVRVGNFMNSEIVGRRTDLPWKVKFPRHDRRLLEVCNQCGEKANELCDYVGERCFSLASVPWRHPSQVYEALMGFTILGILFWIDRKYGERRPLGVLGALFFALYFSGRFTVEFFKEYQTLHSGLTMGQYLSLPFMLGGFFWLYRIYQSPQPQALVKPKA